MSPIRKVALIGKGILGTAVLEQLSKNGFEVTVLSRNPSSVGTLPAGVSVSAVDYTSIESLASALQNQDAAVATIGSAGILGQKVIIDACIKAGVKRYIPSDWGSITTDPAARHLPTNFALVQIQDYVKEKAEKGEIEYTILSVGGFFDLLLDVPFLLDLPNSSVEYFDKGEHPFSVTTLDGVGKAVVGALKASTETKNQNIFVHQAIITQAQIVSIVKKHCSPGRQWQETHLDAETKFQESLDLATKNPGDFLSIMALLKATLLSGKFNSAYSTVDNNLVDLPMLGDEELESILAGKLREKGQ
ncbi:uncharacterized protein BHQ10_001167 [Talaromyces amestolkiae]|uniref:NAD(P)-binding domain-containing protein n=1 Tax=Talaromyces amestolkiae TaxID=1196081 RepID=A0A364KNP9_TALAM|nr:uncharacterized protein BHQ10_001167 [Talaromyces amestolkiae]RAO65155.1 hypothetical protein BHQ10_001167 [Talaromyces amestolkiae]